MMMRRRKIMEMMMVMPEIYHLHHCAHDNWPNYAPPRLLQSLESFNWIPVHVAPSPPFSLSPSSILSFSYDSLAHRLSNSKATTRNLQHWEYSTISRNQIWPRSRSRRWERLNREPRCCRGIYKLPESHLGERGRELPSPFQQPALPLFSWYEYIVILDIHLTFYCFFVCANFGKLRERGSLQEKSIWEFL